MPISQNSLEIYPYLKDQLNLEKMPKEFNGNGSVSIATKGSNIRYIFLCTDILIRDVNLIFNFYWSIP